MSDRTRTITIDGKTAAAIEQRAAELGLTTAQLLADAFSPVGPEAVVADLDERWQRIERGGETVPHDQVVRWLETWGRPDFRSWNADR